MKTFVLNNGSSSVKFQLIDTDNEKILAKGFVERIGKDSFYKFVLDGRCLEGRCETPNHRTAIKLILKTLVDPEFGVIESLEEIGGIGHRVVHGGEKFNQAQVITPEVLEGIRECSKFAPLHNPHNLKGIEICAEEIPGKKQVAVFDTAFHSKMPKEAFLYALPYSIYEKLRIRRYGFHGTSHHYVFLKAAEILGRSTKELRVITCHLGNGCSMAAVANGISVDTTMGFTPLAGLVMGTRCGDIDPAIIPYLIEAEGMSSDDVNALMNKQSGLLGVSGTTNDMREILSRAGEGSERHQLAFSIFCRRVKKYIGAYAALLGGVDAIVFTGGIGENSPEVRAACVGGLEFMGVIMDEDQNRKSATKISRGPAHVLVIPTNEELMIARSTCAAIESAQKPSIAVPVNV